MSVRHATRRRVACQPLAEAAEPATGRARHTGVQPVPYRLLLLLLLLLLPLSACGGQGALEDARARWERSEPAAYAYVFEGSGMAGPTATRFTVRDGRVVGREVVLGQPVGRQDLTLDDVFDLVAEDLRTAEDVRVEYGELGLPVSVQVDVDRNAEDDWYAYGVDDFEVLPPTG